MNIPVKTIDDYLDLQPESAQRALAELRQKIRAIAPEAVEVISYQMPAFKYLGLMLVGFKASKNHCSLYTWNDSAVDALKADLKDFSTSTGTVRFTPEKPIPDKLVKKLVQLRMKQNEDKKKSVIKNKLTSTRQ